MRYALQVTNRFATPLKLSDDILQHPDLVILLLQSPNELFHPGLQLNRCRVSVMSKSNLV
jgi:hypothetical protein